MIVVVPSLLELGLALSLAALSAARSIAIVPSCEPAQIPSAPARPRDPWVFRSVLDTRPRMVTFALSDEMWAAYDATTCTLYKAWKGGVHFDGAVYTTVHGPQPTSEGNSYTEGVGGPAWEVFVADQRVESQARWKGYVFHDGRCTMSYELELPDGRRLGVLETPEFVLPEHLFDEGQRDAWALKSGLPGLRRSFFASDLPPDVKVTLSVCTDGSLAKFCELEERASTTETKAADGTMVPHSYLHVVLTAARRGNNLVLFFAPITSGANGASGASATDAGAANAKSSASPAAKPPSDGAPIKREQDSAHGEKKPQ